jgi:hypothetical protein
LEGDQRGRRSEICSVSSCFAKIVVQAIPQRHKEFRILVAAGKIKKGGTAGLLEESEVGLQEM